MGFLFSLSFGECEAGALCAEVVLAPANEEAYETHEAPVDFFWKILYFKS